MLLCLTVWDTKQSASNPPYLEQVIASLCGQIIPRVGEKTGEKWNKKTRYEKKKMFDVNDLVDQMMKTNKKSSKITSFTRK